MKTNKLIMSIAAFAACVSVSAQTSFDAAKLYDEELNGTARYVGMGGAMSALGSDPSVISHNPAGIGTYHNSDINLSMSFFGTSVATDPLYTAYNQGSAKGIYFYSNNRKSDLMAAVDNVSVIFSGYDGSDCYLNFGFSYRKLQNVDRNLDYQDKFFDYSQDDHTKKYVVYREYVDRQRNKVNSYDFNLSCNLSDMLYLGWTLGILSTDTWSEGYYYDFYPSSYEAAKEDQDFIYYDEKMDYTSVDKMNSAKGTGWNMAFGLIVRPVSPLRLGLSVKTPTAFKQRLEYADYAYAIQGEQQDGNKYTNSIDYKFSSPWSINLSGGLTIGHTAIGVEYEKHFTDRSSLSIDNTQMNKQGALHYQDYSTFKIGIEQNISNLSLRAGYNSVGSMFKEDSFVYLSDSDFNNSRMDWQNDRPGKSKYCTLGLGYCSEPDRDGTQFYFDLAYVHGVKNSVLNTNEPNMTNVDVNYKYKTDKVMFTVGWNF